MPTIAKTLGLFGTDSFSYQASDDISLSNIATVHLTIHPAADLLLG